MKPQEFS